MNNKDSVHSNSVGEKQEWIIFDPIKNYTIQTANGLSYSVEDVSYKNIKITKEQQIFLDHIVLKGDFIPSSFSKINGEWRCQTEETPFSSFELSNLKCMKTKNKRISTKKVLIDQERLDKLKYKDQAIQSHSLRNNECKKNGDREVNK